MPATVGRVKPDHSRIKPVMGERADVAVIGGGIIGLTTAYFLARDGLTVELLDRADLGREASWAGAGIIPPGNPDRAATPVDKLRAVGSVRFPDLAAELRDRTGIDPGYRRCGGVEALLPSDEDVIGLWRDEGIPFERLSPAGVKELEPGVGQIPGQPYLLPGCAQVRNPWHLRALIEACRSVGVRLRPHTLVRGRGDVTAGVAVIATGAWSDRLLGPLGHRPGVRPVRGQIVLLRHPEPVLRRVLMLGKEYLVPRGDGRILVGSTEEPEAGFEKVNTAEAVARLRALAVRTVPALADVEVEACWAGLRPGTPDGLPFIGRVPGHDDVFVAAGHGRAGIQLSIGTAGLVADLILGRPPAVPPEAFALDRVPGEGVRPAFRS